MNEDHFKYMTLALKTEAQSPHPTHKVGALLCGINTDETPHQTAHHNFWPAPLTQHFGKEEKLGNASTTVHAEIATICAAPAATEGAAIYITDLPCPNCAKMIAEAGIKEVYIDSHTHNTPLGLKIKPFFNNISIPVFKSAGVAVYEMDTKKQTLEQITTPEPDAQINIHRPAHQIPMEQHDITPEYFRKMIGLEDINPEDEDAHFAACFAKSSAGKYMFLLAKPHRAIGLSKEQAEKITKLQDKYEPTLQPVNRLLMTCARHGFKINPGYLYSSQTPTAREFVNMIGAQITSLSIENPKECRDEYGLDALARLLEYKIITVE